MAFFSEATPAQRAAFLASWLGWILDAFDFTLFFLVMPHVGREMHLGRAELGTVITATLLGRVLGGPLGGWLCDRYGRRGPMIGSLVLYALFDFLVAFAGSYEQLLLFRFLFGVGMGAEWSAGTALAMEHWPQRSRGTASGLLQGSWAIGYFIATLAFYLVVPRLGWRPLFYLAGVPALLAIFIRLRVHESPSWQAARGARPGLLALFATRETRRSTLVGSLVLGGGFFTYYSLATFYPMLIQQGRGLSDGWLTVLVILFNAGMLGGALTCGALSERVGRRWAIAAFGLATLAAAPLYLFPVALGWLAVGAFIGGFIGVGWTGATPSYLSEHFPAHLRGAGVGTAYHVGALIGALSPRAVPALESAGVPLDQAMAACAMLGAALVGGAVWLRPERRGVAL